MGVFGIVGVRPCFLSFCCLSVFFFKERTAYDGYRGGGGLGVGSSELYRGRAGLAIPGTGQMPGPERGGGADFVGRGLAPSNKIGNIKSPRSGTAGSPEPSPKSGPWAAHFTAKRFSKHVRAEDGVHRMTGTSIT